MERIPIVLKPGGSDRTAAARVDNTAHTREDNRRNSRLSYVQETHQQHRMMLMPITISRSDISPRALPAAAEVSPVSASFLSTVTLTHTCSVVVVMHRSLVEDTKRKEERIRKEHMMGIYKKYIAGLKKKKRTI